MLFTKQGWIDLSFTSIFFPQYLSARNYEDFQRRKRNCHTILMHTSGVYPDDKRKANAANDDKIKRKRPETRRSRIYISTPFQFTISLPSNLRVSLAISSLLFVIIIFHPSNFYPLHPSFPINPTMAIIDRYLIPLQADETSKVSHHVIIMFETLINVLN